MRTWRIAWSAAVLAVALAPAAHADEWNKLTYLTFSAPVDVPGTTLPAGTYRFELADPDNSRRVVRVADKDGTKNYGMFLSIPNQRMTPADKPVVMFKETAAGAPPAVQAWFYPGETYGYEFVYPHDQALKIAKATHQPVPTYTDNSTASTTDADRYASMKSAEVTRIDENDKPVSTDAQLTQSSSAAQATSVPAAPSSTAPSSTQAQATTSEPSSTAAAQPASSQTQAAPTSATAPQSRTSAQSTTAAQPTSAAPTTQPTTTPRSTTAAQPTTSTEPTTAQAATTPRSTTADATSAPRQAAPATTARDDAGTPVGTSGAATQTQSAARPARKQLPKTASTLPLMELLTALTLAGGFGVRAARKSLQG